MKNLRGALVGLMVTCAFAAQAVEQDGKSVAQAEEGLRRVRSVGVYAGGFADPYAS